MCSVPDIAVWGLLSELLRLMVFDEVAGFFSANVILILKLCCSRFLPITKRSLICLSEFRLKRPTGLLSQLKQNWLGLLTWLRFLLKLYDCLVTGVSVDFRCRPTAVFVYGDRIWGLLSRWLLFKFSMKSICTSSDCLWCASIQSSFEHLNH